MLQPLLIWWSWDTAVIVRPTTDRSPSLNHDLPPPVYGIQVKDREAYYTDLQLLRVTKKLQAVLKGDRGDKDKELVQKTEARVEMMERSHDAKVRNSFHTNEQTNV